MAEESGSKEGVSYKLAVFDDSGKPQWEMPFPEPMAIRLSAGGYIELTLPEGMEIFRPHDRTYVVRSANATRLPNVPLLASQSLVLKGELDKADWHNASNRLKLVEAEGMATALTAELAQLKAELSAAKVKIDGLLGEAFNARSHCASLLSELSTAKATIVELEQKIATKPVAPKAEPAKPAAKKAKAEPKKPKPAKTEDAKLKKLLATKVIDVVSLYDEDKKRFAHALMADVVGKSVNKLRDIGFEDDAIAEIREWSFINTGLKPWMNK